jgi:hypothetical protein
MGVDWLTEMPLWALAVLIIGCFVGLSVAGLAITRTWVGRSTVHPNDLAGFVYAVVGVTYAVLLGMSALTAYERFRDVENTAALEANTIASLYRDLEGYPEPDRTRLQRRLHRYIHDVVEIELPRLRHARPEPPEVVSLVDQVVIDWVTFEPTTKGQEALHAEALRQLNTFLTLRRSRLQEGEAGLHPVIWFVLLSGAVLTIGFTYLFWAESRRMHGLMVGFLAGVLGLIVFWMAAMDYPLLGPLSISTDSFTGARDTIDHVSNFRWDREGNPTPVSK